MPKVINNPNPFKAAAKKQQPRSAPLWAGPCGDGPQGGITFSLLSRYLSCKERFRITAVEGLKPQDRFESRMEYGNMWHACEERFAAEGKGWSLSLDRYVIDLKRRFPMQRADIDHWADKCRTVFPLYVDHWRKHQDVKDRKPLMQEQMFDVPYRLPSGRAVRLRGKFDSVDLIGKGKDAAVYVQENKTKSDIDDGKITRQLSFDLQTMIYVVSLIELQKLTMTGDTDDPLPDVFETYRIAGVRYNVVRRSAHKQGKKETPDGFCERLAQLVKDDVAEKGINNEWFQRWKVEIGPNDVAKFKRECLDPVLENLCDDYEWWAWCKAAGSAGDIWNGRMRRTQKPDHFPRHFRFPFGIYAPLAEGGGSDLDEFLATGSTVGLRRADDLFPELKAS